MYLFHEFRDRFQRFFGQGRLKNAKVRRVFLGGLFFALLTLILSPQLTPQRLDVAIGDVAPRDLVAPRDTENRLETRRAREAAANSVPMLQKVDPEALAQAEELIAYAFGEIRAIASLPNQSPESKVETLAGRLALGEAVPPETYTLLLESEPSILATAKEDALNLTRLALAGRVSREDVAEVRSRIDRETGGFTLRTTEPWLKRFIKEMTKRSIRHNLVDDQGATDQLRQRAAAETDPVIWKKDRLILKRGEEVTEEQFAMLQDLRLVGREADIRSLIGTGMLSLVMLTLITLFLRKHRPDILESDGKLLMLGSIGIMTLLLSLLMKTFTESLGPGVAYLMPISVNAMLVAILLDNKIALLQSVLVALLVGAATEFTELTHVMVAIVGSAVAIYMVSRVESRTDIYRAGFVVSAINVVTVVATYMMQAYPLLDLKLWIDAGLGALNGIIVAVIVTGALPLFESLFGIVTPLKLLELSNPNHPLLKRLLVDAPGSYHHTILVANLCEAGAEAVGADQVLARVGAYYHDIGKAKRPYFFVENQFGAENPHDKLPPSLSALIITSHVKDGLEMAREARLPQEIVDFIPEHHGTMLVSYFYHMASKTGQAEFVLEDDFRYEGPKPRSKETAICMLADGCEASVRAIRQKGTLTVDGIEAQVRSIIDDRLKQGQLENCDLTFRDLETIARTFVKVLSGVHHARIEYPPEALPAKLQAQTVEAEVAPEVAEVKDDGTVDQQRSGEGNPDGGAGGDDSPGGGPKPESGGSGSR